MAEYQNAKILREWAPLTNLFEKLPTKTGGIFSQDIKLTCVDALSDFLVLGTNVGIIFWFNRKRNDLQRLRCENSSSPITYIKAVSTVDYMVASGNKVGVITIFQIPKSPPDTLPDDLKPKPKQVERYTVLDLHKSPITALEWSKNGMKLFSGDKKGSIVLTEIDFYMHVCKSIEILNESYEVVQLSYRQQHLLVSTTFRSIICHHSDKWKVCQVGKKDRKVLGKFGGVIHQQGFKPSDLTLYCMRPGLRIWISNLEGEVQKTLLFKDLLCKDCTQVPLLNPISKVLQQLKPQKEASFGGVQEFCDNLLVTYSSDVVYILDPASMTVLATVNNLRSILDIATYKDELFVLEEERSLLRISYFAEGDVSVSEKTDIEIALDVPVANAEEAKEDYKSFDEISNQEFDDSILFSKKGKRKVNHKKPSLELKAEIRPEDVNFTKPTLMTLSIVGDLPEMKSPETFERELKEKEKILLTDVLKIDKLNICLNQEVPTQSAENKESRVAVHNLSNNLDLSSETTTKNKANKAESQKTHVLTLPNDWNVNNVQLSNSAEMNGGRSVSKSIPIVRNERRRSSNNDSSLSDWEIV
ncbi:WD repeat-containing protein CG11141 [Euwallacea fornicatus]|uniref:WD repeat-containing protein CG11141 n=1 Tax=Euwallacea fornicatus TaxID=995702 RepID=UPI00338EA196